MQSRSACPGREARRFAGQRTAFTGNDAAGAARSGPQPSKKVPALLSLSVRRDQRGRLSQSDEVERVMRPQARRGLPNRNPFGAESLLARACMMLATVKV